MLPDCNSSTRLISLLPPSGARSKHLARTAAIATAFVAEQCQLHGAAGAAHDLPYSADKLLHCLYGGGDVAKVYPLANCSTVLTC
jgi:hypothetical protein